MRDLLKRGFRLNRNPSDRPNNAPASRRHAAILRGGLKQIIDLNHGAEAQAAPASSIEMVVQIGHLDRLLSRPRRGPRSTR